MFNIRHVGTSCHYRTGRRNNCGNDDSADDYDDNPAAGSRNPSNGSDHDRAADERLPARPVP